MCTWIVVVQKPVIDKYEAAVLTSQYLKVLDVVRHQALSVFGRMKSGGMYISLCFEAVWWTKVSHCIMLSISRY